LQAAAEEHVLGLNCIGSVHYFLWLNVTECIDYWCFCNFVVFL